MKWFSNLKIRTKLLTSFILISIITAFVGIQGLTNMDAINKMLGNLYENETLGIAYIKEANSDLISYSRTISNYILANSAQERSEHLAQMKEYQTLLFQNLNSAKPLVKSERGKELIAQFEQVWYNYKEIVDQVIVLGSSDSLAEKQKSVELLETTAREKSDEIDSLFAKLTRGKENDGKEYFIKSNQDYASSKIYMIILIIGAVGTGLGVGLKTSRIIVKPLNELLNASNKFASGDTDVMINNYSQDEIGELSSAFRNLIEKIGLQIQYLENIASPVMVIDKEYNIKYMNNFGANLVGKEKKKLIGQKCYDQFKTEHCRTENCALNKAMLDNKIITAETVARPNNKELPILYSGAPLLNKEGKIIGASELVTDITTLKNLQDYLTRSTKNILHAMEKFADGDLTVKIDPEKADDDIGKLVSGFNKSVQNIKNIIESVSEAIQATASASAEISSSTEQMAAGAEEQSQQTLEIASAVEEMTRTILETTKNATTASEASNKYGNAAKKGGDVVEKTITGMNRIALVVNKSADMVQQLGNSGEQIGEIIQVIDDIADQTNLLALNAAIEAARAGEQGRGFAVVADEVRKLAERTTKATKEIASMIKQIQNDTKGAVNSMKEGAQEVIIGKQLADQAGSSLSEIINGADDVVNIIMQVAAASEQQSSSSEQISKNIESISSVSQQSSAGIQQIARTAEDLNRMTNGLQNLILKFNISGNDHIESYKHKIIGKNNLVDAG